MARRPIFIPTRQGSPLVITQYVEFAWHPGLHVKQKQKSIEELHATAREHLDIERILEISTKSPIPIGVSLSAFNLMICTLKRHRIFSVESAYQGSKVFERGGPFVDLLNKPAREAKKDSRLRTSGRLVGFRFLGENWSLDPKTAFYDWLYVNAARKKPMLKEGMAKYDAFSDIEFNPERSINCQAYSAALLVAFDRRGLLNDSIATKNGFLRALEIAHKRYRDEAIPMSFELHSVTHKKVQSYLSKSKGGDMTRFDASTFQSWNTFTGVTSLVKRWQPERGGSEKDYEQALYDFLIRELPYVEITKGSRAKAVGADIFVADTVALEVKSNLDSRSKYRQLLDQISPMKGWAGQVIVLLMGKSNPDLVKALQSNVKAWKSGKDSGTKVTVIKKKIPSSGVRQAVE